MSKNHKKLTYKPVHELPRLKAIKTEWDLKKHYYKSEKDPRIEKDVTTAERAYQAFAKKYAKADFTKNASTLKAALTDYEKLAGDPSGARAHHYFSYRQVLNAKDTVAEKKSNLIVERLTKAGNQILFFELTLGKIPKDKQKAFLEDTSLKHFHYYLSRVFLTAKHTLTEAEEKILNLTSGPASGMWVAATEKIISNRMITFEGKQLSIPEAYESIDTYPTKKKQQLWNLITDEFEQIGEVAENEFNAIVTMKKTSDELRGYKNPYSATIQSYENNEKSVESLVEVISSDGFALSRKFYELKAKYHGVKKIPYVNKYDPIAPPPVIPFDEAAEICRDAFYGTKKEYGAFFDRMLTGGNIDVYPKAGKRGGAFMSSDIGLPTLVFLNHTNNFKSLETLAHEMGHALHSERSKTQSPLYEGYSITTAETASTLFENIVTNYILRQADNKTKLVLLHDRILRDISTIQRQIAFYNFELDLHLHVRKHGAITKEELRDMMQKHLVAYLGKAVEVTKRDGLSYVFVPHFRYGFYVYTYTYGILVSNMMAKELAKDPAYADKIDTFLTAAGTDTVENIFKKIGIDTTSIATFRKGLKNLEDDIKEFERLSKSTS